MASNSSTGQGLPSGGTNNNANNKKVKNPYASKRKMTTGTNNGQQQQPPRPQPQQQKQPQQKQAQKRSPVAGMEGSTGISFSQAFGEIEDTEYYRTSVAEAKLDDNGTNRGLDTTAAAVERAQQRAFEEAAATVERSDPRNNHALLQPHVLSVSNKQRGNGVLNYIRNVPYKHETIVPDYIMSTTSCALFLSCKYHALHPQYIHRRIAELRTDFKCRILLVLVDVEDNMATLLFLNKLAVQQNFTLILAWTEEEAARYLESYKALDGSDASIIQRKEKDNFVDQASDFLAGAKGVNKTDAATLLTQFTSIRAIVAASEDELGMVPGLGQVKVKRLHDALHKPFSSKRRRERKQEKDKAEAAASLEGTESKEDNETSKDTNEPAKESGGLPSDTKPKAKQT